MKKYLKILLFVIIGCFLFNSCTRFEEGGYYSESKLCKKWKIDKVLYNGTEYNLSDYFETMLLQRGAIVENVLCSEYTMEIRKDGTIRYYDMHIEFDMSNEHFNTDYYGTKKEDRWIFTYKEFYIGRDKLKIIKLTKDEFWYQEYDNTIFKFKAKK